MLTVTQVRQVLETALADLQGTPPEECDHDGGAGHCCSRCCSCPECQMARVQENVLPALAALLAAAAPAGPLV